MAPGSSDTFPFTVLVGNDIGRYLMVATNNIANIFCLSGRTVCRWEYYDSLIRDLAPIFLSDSSQILFNPHLGTSFFYLEKNKARIVQLLAIYLVFRFPDTISPIPTFPLSPI